MQKQTSCITAYHEDNNVPGPSFDSETPNPSYPPNICAACAAALNAAQELTELLQGPQQLLLSQLAGQQYIYHRLIDQFDIARKVPLNGDVSYAELAAAISLDESALRRVLRYAISNRFFAEKRPGYVSHSTASRALAEDPAMRDLAGFLLDEICAGERRAVDALVKWPGTQEPTETGYALALGTDFWTVMANKPERARRFAGTMSQMTKGDDLSTRHVVDGYAWSSLGNSAKVVDIGGSTGSIGFALAEKYPRLEIVVQDLPQTIAGAVQRDGCNVRFMVHDMFEPQPVQGADVYFYRWIFHDWPDKYCLRMLRALIAALKPGARVVIMDAVMPSPGTVSNMMERTARYVRYSIGSEMDEEALTRCDLGCSTWLWDPASTLRSGSSTSGRRCSLRRTPALNSRVSGVRRDRDCRF